MRWVTALLVVSVAVALAALMQGVTPAEAVQRSLSRSQTAAGAQAAAGTSAAARTGAGAGAGAAAAAKSGAAAAVKAKTKAKAKAKAKAKTGATAKTGAGATVAAGAGAGAGAGASVGALAGVSAGALLQTRTGARIVDKSAAADAVALDALDIAPVLAPVSSVAPAAVVTFEDRAVDATLLEDLTNMLIQTQARAVRAHCQLLGSWFSYLVQILLGLIAVGALVGTYACTSLLVCCSCL
jgi:hypothetical protein